MAFFPPTRCYPAALCMPKNVKIHCRYNLVRNNFFCTRFDEAIVVPAFFIVLREVIEACLIIGISHAYFKRIGTAHYIRLIWIACISAIIVSLGLGIAFKIVHAKIGKQLLSGRAEHIFEGIVFMVATALLTWMIVWVLLVGHKSQNRLECQLETICLEENHSNLRKKAAIFIMIFIQVLREGVETFIFIFGSACSDDHGGWAAIPIPGVLAIIVGILFSLALFKGFVRLNLQTFFNVSGGVLIAFASGLFSHSFNELQAGNVLGEWDEISKRPWFNYPMWDVSSCCSVEKNEFFAMLRTLFGYNDSPTFLEWAMYVFYWVAILIVLICINWRQLLAGHNTALVQSRRLSVFVLVSTFVGMLFSFGNATWISLASMPHSFVLALVTAFFAYAPKFSFTERLLHYRRDSLRAIAFAWAVNTVYILALHAAQLICEGKRREKCHFKNFYFFGLILNNDFNNRGLVFMRNEKDGEIWKIYWPSIAVLTISATICIFVLGTMALRLYLMTNHIASDGSYIRDDDIPPDTSIPKDFSACSKDVDSASDRLSLQIESNQRDGSNMSQPS